MNNQTVLT